MEQYVLDKQHFYFAGIAGAGMSAIAQYLSGKGKVVSGSDRLFSSPENNKVKTQLEQDNIKCFLQDGSGMQPDVDVLVVSTAIEETNAEVAEARKRNLPIITRSGLLAQIANQAKTVAVAGTSGKSTTSAMLYHILKVSEKSPSFISGAGLVSLIKQNKIGNCDVGASDILIIEADESDGSLVKYKPYIGLLLSIDKDHKEMSELHEIFSTFKKNTKEIFAVNQWHNLCKDYSSDIKNDYGTGTQFEGENFKQIGYNIYFTIEEVKFEIPTLGFHNMENACGAVAVATKFGVSIQECADSLKTYEGIYRRHQILGEKSNTIVIDDYAHNPAKIAASIKACQPLATRLIAWFQPHGYGPTRFIRKELVEEMANTLRPNDQMWFSEIYYAGGTAVKDISAQDLVNDLKEKGVKAYFVNKRGDLLNEMKKVNNFDHKTVILLMGARDPSLENFTKSFFENL